MPKISVIVPIYKVEKYLIQCIDSILNQTLEDIEVILVDEGDLDECRAICDMYELGAKKDERIKTIHKKNGGYGASVNRGLELASGEYISIIESDDFIDSNMFEKMYNVAEYNNADIVKTPYFEYYDKSKTEAEKKNPCFWADWVRDIPENQPFTIKEYPIFMGVHPSIWSCIYKKELLDRYNVKFPENKGAYVDHYFKALTLLNADKIVWINTPFYHYRLTNENASAANFNLAVMIKRWNEFHKLIEGGSKLKENFEYSKTYNLREEFVNTYKALLQGKSTLSSEDCELLKDNLSYLTKSEIEEAVFIKNKYKKALLKLKNNPNLLNKYIKKENKLISLIQNLK